MSVKSVAKLAFACFLSSCYYPSPVIIVVNPAGGQPGYSPGKQEDGITPPYTTPRGNCVLFTSGSTKICYWSLNKPMCQVPVSDCDNKTNLCAGTSNPPPCPS